METLSMWELHRPAQCLLPYLSLSWYLPLSLLVIFILFAAQRPHHLSTRLSSHPICLDKEGPARRSFGNGLGLHQWLNWDASEDVSLALGRHGCGWRGHSFNQNGDGFLFVQTCSLMSTRRDSEDNLQYYFRHTLSPVVLCCQTTICFPRSCGSWTFTNGNIRCVFYARRCCIVAEA